MPVLLRQFLPVAFPRVWPYFVSLHVLQTLVFNWAIEIIKYAMLEVRVSSLLKVLLFIVVV